MKHKFQISESIRLGAILALSGDFQNTLKYLFPVLAFALGIALAEVVRAKAGNLLHWRQISVLAEALILIAVSFFPTALNLPANALTSFACGIQVESFRKIHGKGIATTMCIGNLRSGTENLHHYFHTKERHFLDTSLLYYGIIACFIVGAVIGNAAVQLFQTKAILGCSFLLLISFFMMFIDWEKKEKELAL